MAQVKFHSDNDLQVTGDLTVDGNIVQTQQVPIQLQQQH